MAQATRWTFAGFVLDAATCTLRKNGERVRIPRHFRPRRCSSSGGGDLVTREELRREIWGDRVQVEFENALNECIRQVRAALGDHDKGNVFANLARGKRRRRAAG